jgi:hypothetical protein
VPIVDAAQVAPDQPLAREFDHVGEAGFDLVLEDPATKYPEAIAWLATIMLGEHPGSSPTGTRIGGR